MHTHWGGGRAQRTGNTHRSHHTKQGTQKIVTQWSQTLLLHLTSFLELKFSFLWDTRNPSTFLFQSQPDISGSGSQGHFLLQTPSWSSAPDHQKKKKRRFSYTSNFRSWKYCTEEGKGKGIEGKGITLDF